MGWLEVIELRSAGIKQELLESHLRKLIGEVGKASAPLTMRSYRHTVIDTDIIIHLCHDSREAGHNASPLGLRIASALREFGIVKHGMWSEICGKQPCIHTGAGSNDAERRQPERETQTERR